MLVSVTMWSPAQTGATSTRWILTDDDEHRCSRQTPKFALPEGWCDQGLQPTMLVLPSGLKMITGELQPNSLFLYILYRYITTTIYCIHASKTKYDRNRILFIFTRSIYCCYYCRYGYWSYSCKRVHSMSSILYSSTYCYYTAVIIWSVLTKTKLFYMKLLCLITLYS